MAGRNMQRGTLVTLRWQQARAFLALLAAIKLVVNEGLAREGQGACLGGAVEFGTLHAPRRRDSALLRRIQTGVPHPT